MKKILLLIAVLVIGIGSLSAQKGQKALGINLNYGTEIETVGLGAKFQYGFTEAIRGELAFNHFFEKDGLKMWDLGATAHYLLPLSDKTTFYPLAGLCFTKLSASGASTSDWGANLGCGIEYGLTEALSVGLEAKYQFASDLDQAIFNLGFTYKF